MSGWTSRQRVEVALNHEEPDRVPLDLAISLNAYVRLRDYLGLPVEERVDYDRFFEVRPALDLLEALGVDMTWVRLRSPKGTARRSLPDGTELDAWGVGRRLIELPGGSYLNEVVYSPLEGLDPADIDLDAYPWPDPHAPGYTDGLEEEARRLYDETDLAIMGRFGGPIMEIGAYLRGFEQWLIDLVRCPDFSRDLLNRIADIQIALDEAGIIAAGKYLSVFKVSGEDLGMQDRPLFSPRVWKNVIYPVLGRRWRAARALLDRYAPHVKIMLHSDGAFRPFIPDIIGAGVEVLDPIQSICAGMELAGLKADFGSRLSFHGSVDTQTVLPFGSPEDVAREVRRCIADLGRGGGLILASSHFIQPDVPPENIVALYETAREAGRYPL
jgi:uroporphyrinogen decarboxylase